MRVVCAACNEHYADIDSEMPFEEKLVYSDALALWHAPWCRATEQEHQAGMEWLEALDGAMAAET